MSALLVLSALLQLALALLFLYLAYADPVSYTHLTLPTKA